MIKSLSLDDMLKNYGYEFIEALKEKRAECANYIDGNGSILFYVSAKIACEDAIKEIRGYFRESLSNLEILEDINDGELFDYKKRLFFTFEERTNG